jgi:XTP/dITP diphosphohydrolase
VRDTSFNAVLASSNRHKLDELRSALTGWDIELLALDGYPPETGSTYAENAALKARFGHLHAAEGTWVLGEDSGIEADGLDGRPGVESARWAVDGVARLLAELQGSSDRGARYVCAILAVAPDGTEIEAEGTLVGAIVAGPPRGDEGFGYDPVFVPAGTTRTVAELGDAWKREHSHRAAAARALAAAVAARPTPA